MSDYIMCNNQECMLADYCRRQTDERKKRKQSKYFLNQGDTCEHFIPNEKYKVFAILSNKTEPDFTTLSQPVGREASRALRRALLRSVKKI